MQIREDDLTGQQIANFLQEHLEEMYSITPPGSVHAFDLDALRSPQITFWTAWSEDQLIGCGALKELSESSGEIKSMRTARAYRRQGIASKMLEHVIHEAKHRNYAFLYLQTGALSEFASARSLYSQYGFEYINPFAEYTEDPNSVFMMKKL